MGSVIGLIRERYPVPGTRLPKINQGAPIVRGIKAGRNGTPMRVNKSLAVERQQAVDEFVNRLTDRNWRDRRDAIEHSILPTSGAAAERRETPPELNVSSTEAFEFAAGNMIAAILERLDEQVIIDPDQALIFAMSANVDHQTAACDWFIEQSLITPIEIPRSVSIPDASMTIH